MVQTVTKRARLALAPDTNPHTTGIILPAGCFVRDVYANIVTPEATGTIKTIDVGIFNGDEDGFLAGLPVSAAGIVNGALDALARTRGALLRSGGGGGVVRFKTANIAIAEDTDPHDTAIVIPAGSLIRGAWVIVDTPEGTGTTKTVDVGVKGGAGDGLLNGVSVDAAGTQKGTLASSVQNLGSLLSVDESGAGGLVPEPYLCAAATTINYTLGAANFAELAARIVVEYVEFADELVPDSYYCANQSTVVVKYGSNDFKELVADIIVEYTILTAD